jgi:hypothetical protein
LLTQPVARRRWLRGIAYVIGAFVLLAHVYTLDTPEVIRSLFEASIRDVVYHSSMLALFTLAFRFSLGDGRSDHRVRPAGTDTKVGPTLHPADLVALCVCCGWGALCECLQLFIPARSFSFTELALNTGVPLIVIAVVSLTGRRS